MERNVPKTPFSTRLSGSAKETELRIRNIFQWKKKRPPVILFVLVAALVLLCFGLVSCGEKTGQLVFEPQREITAITLYTTVTDRGAIPVPEEYLDEITAWFCEFKVGKRAGESLSPGTGSTRAEITYADGRTEMLDLSLVERDGKRYYIDAPDAPECYLDLLNGAVGESAVLPLPEEGVVRTSETLADLDLNGDGEGELIERWYYIDQESGATLRYALSVTNKTDNTMLWHREAYDAHVGWNSWFSCTMNGKDCLLWYSPEIYQGVCNFRYSLFTLALDGTETVQQSGSVEFDINPSASYPEHQFDAEAIADFVDELNRLLANSTLLLTTDPAVQEMDPLAPEETLVWLFDGICEYNAEKTMRQNLKDLNAVLETQGKETALAMRSVLKNLSWDNTYGLSTGGAGNVEMAMTGEVMELFGSVADRLIPVDEPGEFKTILGGVTLWLSQDKSERVNFYPGKNYPHVLVNYVTETVKEYASVEDVTLYAFLEAAVEEKYVELHDLDGDGSYETVQWNSKNNRRGIVIFDTYDGKVQRIDVNETVGVATSDYSGQISNIPEEYSNLIMVVTEGANFLYRYHDGRFTNVCTLDEAMRAG